MERIKHDTAFKTRVAIEALRGGKTLSELAVKYGVHPVQISAWQMHLVEVLRACSPARRTRAPDSLGLGPV